MPGEYELLKWIREQQAGAVDDVVRVAAGDDLAALRWPADELLVVGADQVLDGVHFDSREHSPGDIARKVMNRNLSDVAAMAALPVAAIATVALPTSASQQYARDLYQGLTLAAEAFGARLVGGDTGSWGHPLALTVTILARSGGVTPVLRSGAKPGDRVYVTGALGGSILGRHMTFTPRINEARSLADKHRLHAMIDVSDGLARDLHSICNASGVGAQIDVTTIPIHADAERLAKTSGKSALDHALFDGEDHELLFTSPDSETGYACIGVITDDAQVTLLADGATQPLPAKGWDHRLDGAADEGASS